MKKGYRYFERRLKWKYPLPESKNLQKYQVKLQLAKSLILEKLENSQNPLKGLPNLKL